VKRLEQVLLLDLIYTFIYNSLESKTQAEDKTTATHVPHIVISSVPP